MALYGRTRPSGGFELYAWLFMRVSGLLLILLALGHLVVMHLLNSTDTLNFQFVNDRFRTPLWRAYDLLLLLLAMFHGLNGARTVIDDYVRNRGWRVFALSALSVVGLVFIVLGSLVILTFQPR